MLTDEEKNEIIAELKAAEPRQVVAIEALMVVQKHRRWVSDEAIKDVAELAGATPAELDAVATFFPFIYRKRVGQHIIFLCDSMVCWSMGEVSLHEMIRTKLGIGFGETTKDDRFTLLPVSCLGACDRSPAMMVDDELYGLVTPELLEEILEKYQ